MGMSVGGKGGPKSDINITPLIDVILVLLIIFLVTMPIMMRQITIEVPRKKDTDTEFVAAATANNQITVAVQADGEINLTIGSSEEVIQKSDLVNKVRPALEKQSGDKVVFVDFDYAVQYAEVMSVMDLIAGTIMEPVPSDPTGKKMRSAVKIAIKDKSLEEG